MNNRLEINLDKENNLKVITNESMTVFNGVDNYEELNNALKIAVETLEEEETKGQKRNEN